jgi:capsular exopolysaccharide synthesis family protein
VKPVDYLKALRRRWLDVLLAVVVALTAGWFIASASPPGPVVHTYQASSAIVSLGGSYSYGITNLQTLAALATVGDVPQQVAKEINYPGDPGDLASEIKATADPQTGVLKIVATSSQPARTALVANTFARELIAFSVSEVATNSSTQGAALTTQLRELKSQIADLDHQIAAAQGTNKEILTAERDAKVQQYGLVYQAYQQLSSTVVGPSGLQIIPAKGVTEITSGGFRAPRSRASRLILSGFLGLLIGGVIVLVIERFDTRIRTRQDAEKRFGLPVLAEIPYLARPMRKGLSLAAATHPKSRTADAYRVLGAMLTLPRDGTPDNGSGNGGGSGRSGAPRTILVTSPGPGDGKTTVAANLAATFAERGKEVLLLSCDFRRPRLHRVFGLKNEEGLVDALQDGHSGPILNGRVVATHVKGVSLVPSGPPPEKPGEMLGSPAMRLAMAEARSRADVVIVDSAPILTTSDAAHLVPDVDAVLVVARGGRTTADVATRTAELLSGLRAPVAGVTLNAASDMALPRRYYGYYAYYRGATKGPEKSKGFPRLLRRLVRR